MQCHFYSKTNLMHQFLKFILFCNNNLLVSDGLSVHHLEFNSIPTAASICQTETVACLLARTRWNCSLELLMVDGNTVPNMLSLFQNKINLRNWCV